MRRATVIISTKEAQNKILLENFKDKVPKCFLKYYNEKNLCIPLETDSVEFESALGLIKENDMDVRFRSVVHYTQRELEQVPYFHLLEFVPLELEGTTVADYGTRYEGGCPYCGVGQKRVGDVIVDRKFVRKYKFGNLNPELFVSEELRLLIEQDGLTGITFGSPLKDFRGREMPLFYSVQINSVLPRMSESTWLTTEGRCLKCGKDTICLRSDLQYEREKLTDAKDFNLTYEHLDNWHLRNIVISAKVRNLFKKHKIQVGRYTPIAIL